METAARHHQALPRAHQVTEQLAGFGLVHEGTDRHLDDQVLPGFTTAVVAASVFTTLGNELALMPEIDQRVDAAVGFQQHAAAVAAVTAVRSAHGNVFLAPETDTAIAAVTGTHIDFRLIYEFHTANRNQTRHGSHTTTPARTSPWPI